MALPTNRQSLEIIEAADINAIAAEVNGKAEAAHNHPWGDISDAPTIPSAPGDVGAAPAGHDHDGEYAKPADLPTLGGVTGFDYGPTLPTDAPEGTVFFLTEG